MAEIINLRRAKKQLARREAAVEAEQARARHGRTLAQREADARAARDTGRALDGARIVEPHQS